MNEDTLPLYPQKMDPTDGSEAHAPAPRIVAPPAMPINGPLPLLMGPENVVTTCPHCQCSVRTTIKHTVTSRTHITAILCSFICCCCCLPYCMSSTKNTDHYCPNCFKYLGTYEK